MRLQSAARAESRSTWRIAALSLAIALFALSGCGGSKGTSAPASTTASSTATTPSTASTSSSTSSSAEAPKSGGSEAPAGGSALSLAANPEGQLAFSTTSLSAKAGKVTIAFTNSSPLAHNVTVESSAGSVVGATPTFQGASKTVSLTLKPGTYKFFCSVPGHRQAGMEGTLVVK